MEKERILSYAIRNLRPGAEYILRGNTYEGLEWLDKNQPKPSEDEVTNEVERLIKEYNRTEYKRQRAPEYPPITEQLDDLFHAGVFTPEMTAKIKAIKDKYPKQ